MRAREGLVPAEADLEVSGYHIRTQMKAIMASRVVWARLFLQNYATECCLNTTRLWEVIQDLALNHTRTHQFFSYDTQAGKLSGSDASLRLGKQNGHSAIKRKLCFF